METSLTLDRRFAIIDEWILDLPISDRAIRLYAILARYADYETNKAFPSRKTLAARLRCSAASVDRASQELIEHGVMTKRQRHNSSLVYVLRITPEGVSTGAKGGSSPVTRGVLTRDDLTITTKREPKNVIAKKKFDASKYEPSEKIRETFASKYPGLDLESELEAFRDHHLSKGSSFKDWDAAFRTWARNASKWLPKHVKDAGKPAEGPGRNQWKLWYHEQDDHTFCNPGEFGHRKVEE